MAKKNIAALAAALAIPKKKPSSATAAMTAKMTTKVVFTLLASSPSGMAVHYRGRKLIQHCVRDLLDDAFAKSADDLGGTVHVVLEAALRSHWGRVARLAQ